MTSVDFARVRRLVELVHDLDEAGRDATLARECGHDFALRAEVEDVLRAAGAAPQFLAPPSDSVRVDQLVAEAPREVALQPGVAIEGFRLVRRVATGGMGTVWEAQQASPRRKVALKTLRFAELSREGARRFRHESEILARLRHPHVAQVLASGVQTLPSGESLPWYAMEFVEDARTLTEFARERSLDVRARLQLFAVLCEAVQHGHERGVIHRDLKPSNVLVDGAGTLKVIDFGVARVRDGSGAFGSFETETGRVIGTLQYMSPEQIAGASDGIDTRSDVYALGVMLYELVTGVLPYELSHASLAEAARILTDDTPPRPSSRAPRIDADLDAIVIKALEKNRARRYVTAAALGVDLARYLRGEPIDARPPSVTYQVRAFARRHRVLVGATAAAVVTLVAAAPVALWLAWRAWHAEKAAHVSETDALEQRDEARFREYVAEIAAAYAALRGRDATSARQHLDRCDSASRGFEWWYLHRRLDESLWTRATEGPEFAGVAWSPDGQRIYDANHSGVIEVRDAASGALLTSRENLNEFLLTLTLDRTGTRLATASGNGWVRILDAASLHESIAWRIGNVRVNDVVFSADGSELYCVGNDGEVVVCGTAEGGVRRALESCQSYIACLALAPDGRRLAGGTSTTREVVVWDVESGSIVQRMRGHGGYISGLAFIDGGTKLVSSSHDHTLRVWDVDTGQCERVLDAHEDIVWSIDVDATGARLASGSWDRTIRLWNVPERAVLSTLTGCTASVQAVAISPDGTRLVSGDESAHVKMWDLAQGGEQAVKVDGKWFWTLRFFPDGKSLIAIHGGHADRFDAASHRVFASFPCKQPEWIAVAIDPTGDVVALGHSLGYVELWSADGAQQLSHVQLTSKGIVALDWSPDGSQIAAGCVDGTLQLVARDGTLGRNLGTTGARLDALAFAPRKDLLAAAGGRGELRLFDPRNGALLFEGPPAYCASNRVAWSRDGERLALAMADGRIQLWNVAGRTLERELVGHEAGVEDVAFAPDGARLASSSNDRSVRLWELPSGREVAVFVDHAHYVDAVAFSPDGRLLASGSSDSTLRWYEAGDELERRVDELQGQLFLARDVRAALQNDRALDVQARERAVRLTENLLDDPQEVAREAWLVARSPGSEPRSLERAKAMAAAALVHVPDDPLALRASAAACLRLGEVDAALATLDRALALEPADVFSAALHVIALARLGRVEAGQAELEQLTEPARTLARDVGPLIREARSALGVR